ncbi:MAG: type II toxin-antitoxin system RelE/ParE family toxin [Bacillota bacterium]
MIRELVIRPEAEAELAEAYRWYEDRREGLGKDLLLSVEASLTAIQRSPYSYPLVYKDVRRSLIKRFPYGIYYLVEETRIVVIAVFHAKRDPRRWQDRKL